MSFPENTPTPDDLPALSAADIAQLPVELLAILQHEIDARLKRDKAAKTRLDGALSVSYAERAAEERQARGKDTGTIRFDDGDFTIVADLPKRVEWDQSHLAAVVARMRAAGDDPAQYVDIAIKVPERKYTAWPDVIRAEFEPARTVKTGTLKAWDSFKPDRIGAGTIYHLAMERGWQPDASLCLDGSAACDGAHPAAGLLSRLDVQSDQGDDVPASPPFTLVMPDGLVGDLTEYMLTTARRPQPLLSLGASLCAIGALMGRQYRTESNLRSNLYVVGIADSGSGKNHAREILNEIFFEAGLAHHLGGNKIASGAGLLTALHRQPAILFQIDEFGMFLAAAADRKRSPRHITEILDNMTELYTAAGGIFLGAEYANRDGSNERRDIVQPCLCVYGTTTPLHFWGALQGANVVDGSLARFLILPSDEDYPDENTAMGIRQAPPTLIEGLKRVASGGGHNTGNLSGKTAEQNTTVTPMIVPMTAEQLVTVKGKRGFSKLEWQKLRERNEALDCRVYARAAAWIAGADRWSEARWQDLERSLAMEPDGSDGDAAGKSPPRPSARRRTMRSNYME